MKQECDSLLEAFSKMSGEEIVAYFDGLGFIDGIGHPLKNCLPFLVLVDLVKGRLKGKKMSKKSKNRLSKNDKRLIKKAVAKAVASGDLNPQATAKSLKEAFTLVNIGDMTNRKDG